MIGVARYGDSILTHSCGGSPHENVTITQGSDNVYLNNKEVAREGDLCICEDTLGGGSNNVFINNKSVARLNDPTTFHNGACSFAKITSASTNVFVN